MSVQVFVQNEAGSKEKHYHDEKTLVWKRSVRVSRNVDCFVLTGELLRTGQTVSCNVIGLMEQFEDGQEDHNVLAVPTGSTVAIDDEIRERLSAFVLGVFQHVEGKQIRAGRFLGPEAAESYFATRLDR